MLRRAELVRIVIVSRGVAFCARCLRCSVTVSASSISVIVCRRLIVAADTDIGCQFLILFFCQSVEPCKVFLSAEDTTCRPIFIDAAHLPGLQSQPEQLGAVGSVRVEGKAGVTRCPPRPVTTGRSSPTCRYAYRDRTCSSLHFRLLVTRNTVSPCCLLLANIRFYFLPCHP